MFKWYIIQANLKQYYEKVNLDFVVFCFVIYFMFNVKSRLNLMFIFGILFAISKCLKKL